MIAIPNLPATAVASCVREAHGLIAEMKGLIDTARFRSDFEPPSRGLRITEVLAKTGTCKSMIYKLMQEGKFPAQFHVGRASRWEEQEVTAWINANKQVARHTNTPEVKS